MLNLTMRKITKNESPYLYRLSVVCLGRAIDFGVSYKGLSALKNKGHLMLAKADRLKNRFKFRGLTVSKKTSQAKRRPKPASDEE